MNEAEAAVRNQMKNRKGTDLFAQSARMATYNKLLGLNPATAYRQPTSFTGEDKGNGSKTKAPQVKSVSGEGSFDLSKFNG